ncbi:hypothetical protein [Roseimarinus sediminis]|jgi:hypothetical protein|uniref:hypothetical protein n=1 Tax=Roseimarinus sediminis TaxID=1610899 RepID=UPI003D24E32E
MKSTLIIFLFLLLSVLTYLGFYNAFYSPKINTGIDGGEIIVYQTSKGQYHLTDSLMKIVFNEVYEVNNIVVNKGFSKFYSTPDYRDKQTIGFDAGCIVEPADSLKLSAIDETFSITKIEKTHYLLSEFPLKGRMSILIGARKVYPQLDKYCKENGYRMDVPVFEIYDRKAQKITYRRTLVKNIQ